MMHLKWRDDATTAINTCHVAFFANQLLRESQAACTLGNHQNCSHIQQILSRAQALEWQARNACQRFEACFKFQPFTSVRAISRDSFAGYSCFSLVRNPPLPTPVSTRWDLPVKEQREPRCLHNLLCSVGARQFQNTMRVRALNGRPKAQKSTSTSRTL